MIMKRPLPLFVTAIGTLVFFVSPLWAIDVVTQKSTKKQVLGEIGAITRAQITIKPKSGDAVKIEANDIASIKWDGEPAKLNIARGDEDRGNFEKALETYSEVLKDSSGKLKTHLEFLVARTLAKQAFDDPAKLDDAVKQLEA